MEKEFISKKGRKILFRPLKLADLDQALNYINTLSLEDTFILRSGEQVSLEEERKWLQDTEDALAKKTAVRIGAFYNGKLVGVSDIRSLGLREKHVGLFGLTVAKEFRNEGIGTALMEYVLKLGKDYLGLKIATLGVFSNNEKGRYLYKKLGFKEYGNLPGAIFYKGQYVDHVYMYKVL